MSVPYKSVLLGPAVHCRHLHCLHTASLVHMVMDVTLLDPHSLGTHDKIRHDLSNLITDTNSLHWKRRSYDLLSDNSAEVENTQNMYQPDFYISYSGFIKCDQMVVLSVTLTL